MKHALRKLSLNIILYSDEHLHVEPRSNGNERDALASVDSRWPIHDKEHLGSIAGSTCMCEQLNAILIISFLQEKARNITM
jgi:hypothetical protein